MAETFNQTLAIDWTANPNDLLTTGQRTAALSGIGGPHTFNTTTLFLSSFELGPLASADPGSTDTSTDSHTNWNVGDTLYVAGSATTFYQITNIRTPGPELSGTIVTIDGSGQNNRTAAGHSLSAVTGLVDPVVAATVIHKRGDYAGHHGSALRHVRLRNLGII